MSETTAEQLVQYVRTNKKEQFKSEIENYIKHKNVVDFIKVCKSVNEVKTAVDWCIKSKIHLIHKVFEKVENIADIEIFEKMYFEKFDQENRTCLHIAVIFDRSPEILKYLIEKKNISITTEDDYAYTPLHYYCQKDSYSKEVLDLLLTNQNQLVKQSKDGLTPLEFACSNSNNLDMIRLMKSVNMKSLLRQIDNISAGVMEVQNVELNKSFQIDRIWLNLLQRNDKYVLLSYIRNEKNFAEKYYLEPVDILAIIRKCPENGQGILVHIKERYFKEGSDTSLCDIFSGLTGIEIKKDDTKKIFYKSALFLALLTGRFELISPLLRSCQFEIVSYALLICFICKKLALTKLFPDQVLKDISGLKDFCEEYAIEVMYRTYNKDLSDSKCIINNYINRKSPKLGDKSVLEIAYYGKCHKFLSLPICQESLTDIWKKCGINCPRVKFCLHSSTHFVFLGILSYVVVDHIYSKISVLEIICYVYGLGYLIEELRQIYFSTRYHRFHSYYLDPANIIDISALLLMIFGFIFRVSWRVPAFLGHEELIMFQESRYDGLFALRLCLCLSLIQFSMRVLYFASIIQIFGPKLKMISTMIMKDLMPLILIFIVFMVSFGVVFQALLFPNSFYTKDGLAGRNLTFDKKNLVATVGDIFRRATFTIFDFHHTLNDIENNQNDYVTDQNGRYAVYLLLIIFMVVVNVMLMNLLIALFSYTVTRIISESKQSWKSSRYAFIHEYYDRTIAPPPFNILAIPIEVLIFKVGNYRSSCTAKKTGHENIPLVSNPSVNETPDEHLISYYIYQAFAMSGQRYRLHKDVQDIEYEKEAHFRLIEEKLRVDKEEIKALIKLPCKRCHWRNYKSICTISNIRS